MPCKFINLDPLICQKHSFGCPYRESKNGILCYDDCKAKILCKFYEEVTTFEYRNMKVIKFQLHYNGHISLYISNEDSSALVEVQEWNQSYIPINFDKVEITQNKVKMINPGIVTMYGVICDGN